MKCPSCGSNSWRTECPGNDGPSYAVCDDCGAPMTSGIPVIDLPEENSGGRVSYYEVHVLCPLHQPRPYIAESSDIIAALGMNPREANMFKELWRGAAARQGLKKEGNNPLRGAEKLKFFADFNLKLEKFYHDGS